jgi:cell division protein FtsZ
MHRRQLLQVLNAVGASIIFPDSEFYVEGQSVITPPNTTSPVAPERLVELADSGWDIPKVGIVAIGRLGNAVLNDLTGRLPYLALSIAIDKDLAALNRVKVDRKIRVGDGKSFPLDPHAARLLAQASMPEITDAVAGLDMVFLVAHMSGETVSGIAPLVAQILREQGILTLAFASLPSCLDKQVRQQTAQTGVQELRLHVDALLPFYDGSFAQAAIKNASFTSLPSQAALAFNQLWQGVLNPVCRPGLVNIDFSDLKNLILSHEGDCAFGFGSASSAEAAALIAIDHPLLGQHRLQQAAAVLMTVRAPTGVLKLGVSTSALRGIRKLLPQDPWIIFGAHHDDTLGDEISVSVLASGIRGA